MDVCIYLYLIIIVCMHYFLFWSSLPLQRLEIQILYFLKWLSKARLIYKPANIMPSQNAMFFNLEIDDVPKWFSTACLVFVSENKNLVVLFYWYCFSIFLWDSYTDLHFKMFFPSESLAILNDSKGRIDLNGNFFEVWSFYLQISKKALFTIMNSQVLIVHECINL